ncbi:hypothetical protein [Myxococcus vastator]|uniref:hypothetical protein n=1 Tax=Myxococcus vastator TaxID=2709664 RepID=UPI0013CF842C|nr:hypothetical protein [Myxococcus vastator]
MSNYDDLFFRTNLEDVGQMPSPLPAYTSPDIIPYGTLPTRQPKQFFAENYANDVGQNLVKDADNYIYLRAKNLAGASNSGNVCLYALPANLLLYPYLWKDNELQTSDKNVDNHRLNVIQADGGGIAVTDNPFVWRPDSADHHCLVSRVVTSEHPSDIPDASSVTDLSEFIINNPGFGWRNVTIVDAGKPDYTTLGLKYAQGTEAATISFDIFCTNVPQGASVAFSAGTSGPSPLIALPKQDVGQSLQDDQGNYNWHTGIDCFVPANYKTDIDYSYWPNGKSALPGMSITLKATQFVSEDHRLYHRLFTPQQLKLSPKRCQELDGKRGVVLGSHTMLFR